MKTYVKPELYVVKFKPINVIATSGPTGQTDGWTKENGSGARSRSIWDTDEDE